MERQRIVNSAFDTGLDQGGANHVALGAADYEQVVTGFYALRFLEKLDSGELQLLPVVGRDLAPASIPLAEPFQLGQQDRRLQRVQARVVAIGAMSVMRHASMVAQMLHLARKSHRR